MYGAVVSTAVKGVDKPKDGKCPRQLFLRRFWPSAPLNLSGSVFTWYCSFLRNRASARPPAWQKRLSTIARNARFTEWQTIS